MRAKVWGCRGSLAAPGPETIRYGGNTSCLEVRPSDDRLLVIDAGTGIRSLGVSMGSDHPKRIDILLSHLHLDHIEGLGFFMPLWDHEAEIHIWGPPSPTRTLREGMARYFSPPLFPVHLDDIPSKIEFHDVPNDEWDLGEAHIRSQPVNHPGPTLGYRIEESGRVLTYISDHEPAMGVDLRSVSPDWISGYSLAYQADLLFHDCQYTEEEYPHRVGWGHSSVAHTSTFAQLTKVRRLMLFHHDPLHSDQHLEAILLRARELMAGVDCVVDLSYEGMEVDLSYQPGQRSILAPG